MIRTRYPYTDIVDHHLIETGGTKRALHDIGDSLGRKDYHSISHFVFVRAIQGTVIHTILVSNIGTADLLASENCAISVSFDLDITEG